MRDAEREPGRDGGGDTRRLAAVLVADVVGYSRLMEADEAGTLAAVRDLWRRLVEPVVQSHAGRVVKFLGDGLLAEFASAVEAVACALAVQQAMGEVNAALPPQRQILLRIGINLGDLISSGADIFGEGVNIAARLEAVADPGGICISAKVHEEARGRLAYRAEELGELTLKNITRPVRAFRVAAGQPADAPAAPAAADRRAVPLSIAVLPFVNMSSIPEQEYMCDGIAENIITDLARFRDLTVIARNSSFAYRGKAVRAQEIRHDLGADFILEGSVQRAGERVRVTAQLIDGASGRQVWAERYDRTVDDLFAVMDDVTQIIVGTLGTTYGGRLRKAAGENVIGAGTGRFRAFVSFLRGMEAFNRFTRDSIATAIGSLSEALALDPRYAKAQAKLAWAHIADIYLGFSEREDESWAAAHRAAVAALAADDDEAWGHWAIAGCALFHDRQFDRCIAEMRRALELNPNDADVLTDMGLFLAYAGEADEGLAYAQHALRINPHRPDYNVAQLAQIQHDARRYQEALVSIDSIRGMNTALMQVYAASSHAALGQTAAAGAAVARLLAGEPKSSVAYWTGPERAPYRRDEDRAHLAANLKAAGLRD